MFFKVIEEFIFDLGMNDTLSKILATITNILIIALMCLVLYILLKIITKIVTKVTTKKTPKSIITFANNRKFTKKVSWFLIVVFISNLSFVFPSAQNVINKLASYITLILLMVIIDCVIKIICDFYATKPISRKRPIKGIMQITEIVIFLILGITIISLLINQSPLVLIGGIGTFTAILSIVFKDALLGLVAGVQITSDDLLRIGDWVEIPSQGVEGTVQDIALITVKIRAFDNTLYTIPAYTFLSVPFKNWHTAINEKARRVNRTISLDVRTVKPINTKDLDSVLNKYDLSYMAEELKASTVTSGELTNLTVFRSLLPKLIKKDDKVCKDRLIVCQVSSENSSKGIPVEFIFFTKETEWEPYSAVSASKLDLALSLANELNLKMFQDKTDAI